MRERLEQEVNPDWPGPLVPEVRPAYQAKMGKPEREEIPGQMETEDCRADLEKPVRLRCTLE